MRNEEKRIKQSPKLPAGERREQLLKAAHELFLKKGYRATGTDEIARKAGVTKGALYFHFKSKEDILLTFVHEIIEGHMKALQELEGTKLSPADLLVAFRKIDEQMPLPEARRNLSMLAEVVQVPRCRKLINAAYERSVEIMSECLDPGYGNPEQRRRLVELSHALYDGICFAGMIHKELGDFERQIETFDLMTSKKRNRRKKKDDSANAS